MKHPTKRMQERAWARHVKATDELVRRQERRRRRAAQRAKGGC